MKQRKISCMHKLEQYTNLFINVGTRIGSSLYYWSEERACTQALSMTPNCSWVTSVLASQIQNQDLIFYNFVLNAF